MGSRAGPKIEVMGGDVWELLDYLSGRARASTSDLGLKRISFACRKKPASAAECAGLLAATIAGMVAIVGNADPMEPFQ